MKRDSKKENDKTSNGFNKQNGVRDESNGGCKMKENGVCREANSDAPNIEEIPFEVNKACGDYTKDGKVFLTRRTAKATYGPEYDYDRIMKK